MVLWIGVDDTDSLQGMCTTFLATEIVRDLTDQFDLIGYPRLVRLNPNVPWKTRGNGAVCIRIGEGHGTPVTVGLMDGREIVAFPRGRPPEDLREIVRRVAALVERWSRFEDETTHPGFAVLERGAPPDLYWRGVRSILTKEEVLRAVRGRGVVRGYKCGRGVIGAVAATAWRPRDRTYELLAYRRRTAWGTLRHIDSASVVEMDRAFPSTFNNYDYESSRVVIAPRSPCPILFGIRGENPSDLFAAHEAVRGEAPERSLIFETNQGTDDHVASAPPGRPCATIRVRGAVSASPRVIPGGHLVFRVDDMDVTVYEPAKRFRDVVRRLIQGDEVEVIGAVRDIPRTLNLEKVRLVAPAPLLLKVANPLCVSCRKRAKSSGRLGGYRCVRCGRRFPRSAEKRILMPRALAPGWYEPPVGSRRHLSKPLKRGPPTARPSAGDIPGLSPREDVSVRIPGNG